MLTIFLAVYKHFMEAIDGIDNGGFHCKCPFAISAKEIKAALSPCPLLISSLQTGAISKVC